VQSLDRILSEHPFFTGLQPAYLALVSGCAKNVRFEPGEYLLREGAPADWFYLLRHGHVALQVNVPGRGAKSVQTLHAGEVVGVSWLIPPYRWNYDARALEPVRAIALDAACLRGKCEADHHLGYDLMQRIMPVLIQRLHAARLQFLDVYGPSR
jgi:CRP-like cAMP-binding protein